MKRYVLTLVILATVAVTGCGRRQGAWQGAPAPSPALSPAAQPTAIPTASEVAPPPLVIPPTPSPAAEAPSPAPSPVASGTPTTAAPATVSPATAAPAAGVTAVFSREVTEAYEPKAPTGEFPEDAARIYLALKSDLAESARMDAAWIAVNVENYDANDKISETHLSLQPGARGAMYIEPPRGGFQPGGYRVDLTINGNPGPSVPFKVVPILPAAAFVEETPPPRGFNVGLAALGGKVEAATSQYDDERWAARNINDGLTFLRSGRSCALSCGWSSRDATVPQEVVLSFYRGREARIAAVVIDTTSWETQQDANRVPKHVEVWVSTSSATAGFTRLAGARLHMRAAEQLITFPVTPAKYLKLRFLSNHGGPYTQVGEVKVIEAVDGPSILADAPRNLASPALGGALVRFTSKDSNEPIYPLVDGSTETEGWRSAEGPFGPASYLPQEFVFAFKGEQAALVDRVVINPKSRHDPSTWPKVVTVSVSTESPLDGFQEVGQFPLRQQPVDQALPVGRLARFLRLRILKNFGGSSTSLGEVRILEGSAPGYTSVLLTPEAALSSTVPATPAGLNESGIVVEREPNNIPAEANPLPLGTRLRGTIDPLGELDHFRLSLPGTAPGVMTLELVGRPYIRTSLTLLDPAGQTLKAFDPGLIPAQRAAFSWLMKPGDHLVRVTEPPISMVLIWDTSGSMTKESVENLRLGVEAYIDQVGPSERVNLIRFSNKPNAPPVEVLLPEFTGDRARLKAAAAGKFFAEGGTPFYDALARGIELLEGARGNRAIVVMTDGADTTSRLSHAAFWHLLERKRIRIYTIGLGPELPTYEPLIGSAGGRVLRHIALASNGRFFFTRNPEELKSFYQQIAEELRTVSTYYLRATLSTGPGRLAVASIGERIATVSAPSQIELILDASGSMKARVEGRPKIDTAKDVMVQVIKDLPDDARVALRFYGHRVREGRPGDCQDSQLVFPFGKIDKPRMISRVREIRALGTTPIAYTLQQVARDFGGAPGEKLVILVTDGKEECGGSPSAVVADMVARGIKVRLNIVGFALADAPTKQEMDRVAKVTGGKFFDAANAAGLTRAIQESLAVPFDVVDAAGTRVGTGITGQGAIQVAEGIYTIVVRAAGRPVTVPNVRVAMGGFTKVVLKKEGQEIGIQVQGP